LFYKNIQRRKGSKKCFDVNTRNTTPFFVYAHTETVVCHQQPMTFRMYRSQHQTPLARWHHRTDRTGF